MSRGNDQAYPCVFNSGVVQEGMTIREAIAKDMAAGMLANPEGVAVTAAIADSQGVDPGVIQARIAVQMANRLLTELEADSANKPD